MKKQFKNHSKAVVHRLLCLLGITIIFTIGNLRAQTACNGDIFLYSQADVDNFPSLNCTIINGNLTIDGTDVTNLTGLSNLTSVNNLYIYHCDALVNVDGLSSLTSVDHQLNIEVNASLVNIDGLSNLTSVGSNISIAQNASLTNIDGLIGITAINSVVSIWGNGSLNNLDGLSNLASAQIVVINDNYVLTNVDGLSSILTLGEYQGVSLRIANNSSLTEYCGLYPLFSNGTVAGSVTITGNGENPTVTEIVSGGPCDLVLTNQSEVDAFNYVDFSGNLTINDLISGNITNLDGLAELTEVGRDLIISSNQGLLNTDGLSNLVLVGGDLNVQNNSSLANLDGLSNLNSIGDNFSIIHNVSLANLDSLSSLSYVGGNLDIMQNLSLLEYCGLYPLFSSGGVAGNITIWQNAPYDNPTVEQIISEGPCPLVYDGDLIITNQSEIDEFIYREVTGSLIIDDLVDGNITNLDGLLARPNTTNVPLLTTIGNNLIISNNNALINLNGLTFLSSAGSLNITNNISLSEFCGLYTVLAGGGVNGDINISGNAVNPTESEIIAEGSCMSGTLLITTQSEIDNFNYIQLEDLTINDLEDGQIDITNLDGLSELLMVTNNLFITSNPSLTNVDGLSNLSGIYWLLDINDNSALTNINGLNNLQTCNTLSIRNNISLTEFCGIYPIIEGGSYYNFVITDNGFNPTIQDIITSGPCIPIYNGDLNIASQAEVDVFEYVEVSGNLIISGVDIENLYSLLELTSVGGDLYITNNPTLTSLDGLNNLTNVGGDVIIDNNLLLIDLDALSISSLNHIGEDLIISNNSILTNLDGLSSLGFVGGNLSLLDNVSLVRFSGLYLLFNFNGVGGSIIISGNGQNPTSAEIISGGPCTAEDRVLTLIDRIVQLVNISVLNQGQCNAMTTKLSTVLINLNKGKINVAVNLLNAFINQTNDFINEHILTNEQGQHLINVASEILELINNNLLKQVKEKNQHSAYNSIPAQFVLEQNYPNPFNPTTTLVYGIPEDSPVVLTLYNILGSEIMRLDEGYKTAGYYSNIFDASNLPSGVYFYQLRAGDFVQTKKMILLK